MELKICHLYPDVLNLYGDTGNIICMKNRLMWRGIDVSVTNLPIGETQSLAEFDLFFLGGGQDFEQEVLLEDLHRGKDKSLVSAIEDGKTILAICGGYQMPGNYYLNASGHRCDFLGAVDFYTVGSARRMIGNYAFRCDDLSSGSVVVGFENHSGRTFLGDGVQPLGKVITGYGNNGKDRTEGVRYKNVFGTYSHGPVLPPLDDTAENDAHNAAYRKLIG